MTHESNIPKDADNGERRISRETESEREQIVRPVSSSNVALGSFAEHRKSLTHKRALYTCRLTIF